ncbi:MAG: DUF2752 domain-containing protein [Pyrinomonadaceae bacterium]
MLPQTAFLPISSVLSDRKLTRVLAGVAGFQIVLVSLNLPAWECPFLRVTGVPCPGCGLTRAIMLLLQGEIYASIRFHAFAPIFLICIVIVVLAALLPKSSIQPVISRTELLERQKGLSVIVLSGLILYWLARLLDFPAFIQLIRG